MGSQPSTPNGDGSQQQDHWASIENINFSLNLQSNTDEEGHHQQQQQQQINANSSLIDNNNNNINSDNSNSSSSSSSSSDIISEENTKENCEKMENINNSESEIINNENHQSDIENTENENSLNNSNDDNNNNNTISDHVCDLDDEININNNKTKFQTLDEFKEELRIKRESRQNALSELRQKFTDVNEQLAKEKLLNKQLILCLEQNNINPNEILNLTMMVDGDNDDDASNESIDTSSSNNDIPIKSQLAEIQLSLQLANSEILSLTSELQETRKHITSLKEVVVFSKQMITIREQQVNQLKVKLQEIEASLSDRETQLMSDNLKKEYERQLENIRNLKNLYEDRARVADRDKVNLIRQLEVKTKEIETEKENSLKIQERNAALEEELDNVRKELSTNHDDLAEYKSENRELQGEMTVINQLCGQMIMGFNGGNDINIDKLTNMLEDNRDLLQNITNRETSTEVAATLPKLLFDIVSDADAAGQSSASSSSSSSSSNNGNNVQDVDMEATNVATKTESDIEIDINENAIKEKYKNVSVQEIINNLPKVYKVLNELLNHQKVEQVVLLPENNKSEDCYNSVQTSKGTELVLSVSKTYIKLKDLILEKKFLQKETHKLKHLNNHLEVRLGEQEKRLSAVTIELNKTWTLVGRMQRQHRQLHTSEQALRYQLQQKRRMLTELKDELDSCRRMWALARQKNNETQHQWDRLRLEFSNRKLQDANNSAESGYSDDPVSDDDDDIDNNKKNVQSASPPSSSSSSTNNNNTTKSEQIIIKSTESASKQFKRLQSLSPQRNSESSAADAAGNDMNAQKRCHSAPPPPPTINILSQIFQTTSEIIPLTDHQNALIFHENNDDRNNAIVATSSSTTTIPVMVNKTEVIRVSDKIPTKLNISSSAPSSSGSGTGVKSKCIASTSRIHLSRDPNRNNKNNENKATVKTKTDETLEEMFLRITGNKSQESIVVINEDDNNNNQTENQYLELQNNTARADDEPIEQLQIDETNENNINTIENNNIEISDNNAPTTTDDDDDDENQILANLIADDQICGVTTAESDESNQIVDDQISELITEDTNVIQEDISMNNSELQPLDENVSITPSSESSSSQSSLTPTEEAYLQRRNERLLRLEEQSAQLLNRMTQSAERAVNMNYQLDELHSRYGPQPVAESESVAVIVENTAEDVIINGTISNENTSSNANDHETSNNNNDDESTTNE